MSEPTVADLAYAAGIFDGEGCLIVVREKRPRWVCYTLRVTISMTDGPAVRLMSDVFGGPVWASKRTAGRKDINTWVVSGAKAAAFLRGIRPYVRVKAAQVDLALEFQQYVQPKGNNRAVTPEVQAIRETYWRRMQELKQQVVA